MTRHLGELGRKREPVDMDFGWFGERIRVGPKAGTGLMAFLDDAESIAAGDTTVATIATRMFLRTQIHEDDWAKFLRIADENDQQLEDLLQLARDIVEAVSNHPIGRRSDSSAGPPSTNQKLRDGYSSAEGEAMARLKGRPDLKMVVWEAHKARHAEAAAAA
jgi:hypothetical protein